MVVDGVFTYSGLRISLYEVMETESSAKTDAESRTLEGLWLRIRSRPASSGEEFAISLRLGPVMIPNK